MGAVEIPETQAALARHGRDRNAIRALIMSYYQAVNESRWDDVVEYFHADGVLLVSSQRPKIGHEAIGRFYRAHGTHFPEHTDTVPLLMIDGNRVLTLVDFNGVDSRGHPVQFWTGGTFTLESGRFRQYRVIFDTGALPEWIRSTGHR